MDIAGDRTLYSVLLAHAREQPDQPWLAFQAEDGGIQRWTFQEFLGSVHQAARILQNFGIGRGDVFAIHLPNHPAVPQLILAASCLEAVAMPTNPKSTREELAYLLSHSESKLVFAEEETAECVQAVSRLPVIVCQTGHAIPSTNLPVYEREFVRQSAEPLVPQGKAKSLLQLLYTSGTTSHPKGVMLSNANFIYGAEVFRCATGLRKDDHHLIPLPLFHAAAQCHALWPSLLAGCRATILSRFSASRFFEQAVTHGATMAALFGAPLRMLLNQPVQPTDRSHGIRNITFAQSLTESAYAEWHRRFGVPLQQLWGMTETCSLPVMSPLTNKRRLAAMGRPVIGYEVKIVADNGSEVAPGETGHLKVRGTPGRSLMIGYLKNPEATEKTLRQEHDGWWLCSGDMVSRDTDDFIYFMHRGNDLIRRSGENISGLEVEDALARLDGVQEVCVVGLPDPVLDEIVAAAIVPKPGCTVTLEDVRQHCKGLLISHKIPEFLAIVNAIPRTSVGKIQKKSVREMLLQHRQP